MSKIKAPSGYRPFKIGDVIAAGDVGRMSNGDLLPVAKRHHGDKVTAKDTHVLATWFRPLPKKEWKIDVGNSSVGPVGFVAYVTAPTKRLALRRLKANMPDQIRATDWAEGEVNVYFNLDAVTLKDVQPAD